MIVQSGFYDTLRWSLPIVSAQSEQDAELNPILTIGIEPDLLRFSLIGDYSDRLKPKQAAKKPSAHDRGSYSNYRTNSIEVLFGKMFTAQNADASKTAVVNKPAKLKASTTSQCSQKMMLRVTASDLYLQRP